MGIAPASLMCRVSPGEPTLLKWVEFAAHAAHRPVRPLQLQALLQLPRLADSRGFVPSYEVRLLLSDLAQELPENDEWIVQNAGLSPRLLRFHEVEFRTAFDVMKSFHYLRSPRTDGRAYGLSTTTGRLVALAVSSPLDVEKLRELLASQGYSTPAMRVLSRVFAFEGAPRNSISYMLSQFARKEAQLGARGFVTYVNPNMGFSGSSYLASGWQLLGMEPDTKYRYIDGRYITDRELVGEFGARADVEYERVLGARFSISSMDLKPLLVFHSKLE